MLYFRLKTSLIRRRGFSYLELLAVLLILGIIAAVAVQRLSSAAPDAKKKTCYVIKGNIEVQAQLYYRNTGAWPASVSTLANDPNYFPEGVPTCPVDGSAYVLDANTHQVTGHQH